MIRSGRQDVQSEQKVVQACRLTKTNKNSNLSMVEFMLSNKQYIRLDQDQTRLFMEQHQIVNCAYLLHNPISYAKITKLYFILFQISTNSANLNKQIVLNFLCEHQFATILNECMQKQKTKQDLQSRKKSGTRGVSERIILKKISKFLDSFKQGRDRKTQLDSLVNEYHEYRHLGSDSTLVRLACDIIQNYITQNIGYLINQLQITDWRNLSDGKFVSFYKQFCQLCTICKRINYIKCGLINLGVVQIPYQIRDFIQQKFRIINSGATGNFTAQSTQTAQKCEQKKMNVFSKVKVKKNLNAINSLINRKQANN